MLDDYSNFSDRITEIANYLQGRKLKIVLSDDELNKIEQLTDKEVYNKNYYVKRIYQIVIV